MPKCLLDQVPNLLNPFRLFWNRLVGLEHIHDRNVKDEGPVQTVLELFLQFLDRLIEIFDI